MSETERQEQANFKEAASVFYRWWDSEDAKPLTKVVGLVSPCLQAFIAGFNVGKQQRYAPGVCRICGLRPPGLPPGTTQGVCGACEKGEK